MKLTKYRLHVAFAALLICVGAVTGHAQTAKQNSPLKIGTIKDYPATGMMTGCGNLYVHRRGKSNPTDTDYLFLSRGDGSNAWMNLNGRDVRLRQIKIRRSAKKEMGPLFYRYRNWQVTVAFQDLNANDTAVDPDGRFQMKITFRRGRAVRVVQAVGSSDC